MAYIIACVSSLVHCLTLNHHDTTTLFSYVVWKEGRGLGSMGGEQSIPSRNTMRAPVPAIMALCGDLLVALELGCEFYLQSVFWQWQMTTGTKWDKETDLGCQR